MRISTNQYFNINTSNLTTKQGELGKLQGQLATGVRVQKPSEDPLAMATAMGAQAGVKQIEAYEGNLTYVQNQLTQMDDALGAASEMMTSIKESMVAARNGTISANDRQILVEELRGKMESLRGIANRQGPSGDYILAGTQRDSAPFPQGGTGDFLGLTPANQANVKGREIQVANGRSIDLKVTGYDAFVNKTNNESVFQTLDNAINALDNPGFPNGMANATQSYAQVFEQSMGTMDDTFNQVQLARTKVGVRMREADTITTINASAKNELQRVASQAVGLDYAKAISDLAQGQLQLQASQQSFSNVSKLSLFNYLN